MEGSNIKSNKVFVSVVAQGRKGSLIYKLNRSCMSLILMQNSMGYGGFVSGSKRGPIWTKASVSNLYRDINDAHTADKAEAAATSSDDVTALTALKLPTECPKPTCLVTTMPSRPETIIFLTTNQKDSII